MLGVHPMTVSKWERGAAEPAPYNIQQLLLLEEGAERMDATAQRRFLELVTMGLFVAALAFAVGLAIEDLGRRQKWW